MAAIRELVEVAHYRSAIEAGRAKLLLELEGIPTEIDREPSSGHTRLRVARPVVNEALALLRRTAEAEDAPTAGGPAPPPSGMQAEETRCLICGSSFVETRPGSWAARLLRLLLRAVIPLPAESFKSRERRCGVCGHQWKEPRRQPGAPSSVPAAQQYRDHLRDRSR